MENQSNDIIPNMNLEQNKQEKNIKKKLNTIVDNILNDFTDITYINEININQILNFMIKNKSNSIIKENSMMLRILKQEINKIVDEDNVDDLNEMEQYNDLAEEFKTNLSMLEKNLKSIRMCLFDNYFNDINKNVNISIKDLKNFDAFKLESILDSFNFQYDSNISNFENISAILFIIGSKFLNMKKDFELELKELNEEIEGLNFDQIVSNKLKSIYFEVEKFFNDKSYYNTKEFLLKNIKEKILKNNGHSLYDIDLGIERIYEILDILIGLNPIKWLETPLTKNISLETFLFYKQNEK